MSRIEQSKLSAFFKRYSKYLLYRRLVETIAVLVALVTTFFVSIYFIETNFVLVSLERISLLAFLILSVIIIAVIQGGRYLLESGKKKAALTVEELSSTGFSNELVTAVDLMEDEGMAQEYGFSPSLVTACIDSAASKTEKVSFREVISLRRVVLLLFAALLTAVPFGTLHYIHPFEADFLLSDYMALLGGYGPQKLNVTVSPGSMTVASGSTMDFSIVCTDEISTIPVLEQISESGKKKIFPLTGTEKSKHSFSASIGELKEDFFYRFAIGPVRSGTFKITVVDPPALVSGQITYEYPDYTRLMKEKQKENLFHVRAPEGTNVLWSLGYSQPVTSAHIIIHKTSESDVIAQTHVKGKVEGNNVTFSFKPVENTSYSIKAVGADGFFDPVNHKYRIEMFKDSAPRTFVLKPAADLSVEAEDITTTFHIKVFSEDDYGLTGGQLTYTLRQRYEYTFSKATFVVPFKLSTQLTRLTTTIPLDLSEAILQPGDSVSYFYEAFDGYKPVRSGKTRSYHIRIPYKTDDFNDLLDEHQKEITTLDDVLNKQKDIDKRLDDVVKRVAKNKDMKWRDRQEMEKILEKQKKLRKEAQEVTAGLEKTIQKMEKKNILSESALQKLQQVHELMAEVSTDRMKNMMQKMQEMMSKADFNKKQMNSIMKGFDEEKYTRELDKVLSNLKKLKAQQELAKALHDTKELIKEQESLLQKTMEKAADEESITPLTKQQSDLAKKARKNASSLSKVADSLKEHFPEASEQVGKEAQKNNGKNSPSKDMENAAKAMASNDKSDAMKNQQKALSKMRASLEELNQIKGKMEKKQASVNIEAVTTLLYKAIELSWLSGAVAPEVSPLNVLSRMPSTSALRREECKRMASASDKVWRRFVSFEKDFNQIFSDELMFKGAYLTAISKLIEDMGKGRHDFEQVGYFSGIQLVRRTGQNFNKLILQLLQLTEKMKDSASQSSQQNFMDQMEEMIQRQEQLNEMCNRQGQRPKSSPMMQQMFNNMASEQMMIKNSMEELARRYEEGMKLDERLQKVADEMKEVADRLSKFDGGEVTKAAQKKIVTRMLDYTRSMHNQDFSKERKSKDGNYIPIKVIDKTADTFEIRKEIFKNMTGDSYPPQFSEYIDKYMDAIFNSSNVKPGANTGKR